jgi:NAD-dependent SIR2 family protein deacetylase
MTEQAADHLTRVRDRLAAARNVMVITGAGVSAESGIPTFRGENGLWQRFNPLDYATREAPLAELPPTCMCGNVMRPDIVWFGEALPRQSVEQVQQYLLHGGIDLCLVIGTEASFGYIVQWALAARESGALLADLNPRETGLGPMVDVHLEGRAGDILPLLA